MNNKSPNLKSFADHAEEWWQEQGKTVPQRYSESWYRIYEAWVEFAFQEFDRDCGVMNTTDALFINEKHKVLN